MLRFLRAIKVSRQSIFPKLIRGFVPEFYDQCVNIPSDDASIYKVRVHWLFRKYCDYIH